jgi:23S rRNA pseudouridine2604 synthase
MTDNDTIRLSKRVADMVPCSRREAELYIEGGFVHVDGVLVEEPGARVAPQHQVELAQDATLLEIVPVTILLNKPAGVSAETLLTEANRAPEARRERFLKRHVANLQAALPLPDHASGLFVFTQDFRVARKLVEEGAKMEQEIIVDVDGTIADNGLALLNQGATKVSWQNETRLRFAIKGPKPHQIDVMCKSVGLTPTAIRRIRLGRIAMSSLPLGQWRYLQGYERF